ncbi:amidohydrolase family protein [Gleimia hominis]|uniref:Amidohydrolase family protein n=1 Tax=Gleimia hominis TaxID=595468 RepID=A0ABU3IFB6_9ACTO|nr:amidohydrolase family protein [Gleimia hominis]MDT3767930.1 amidohydrolase family protein [Gleimia hominis]
MLFRGAALWREKGEPARWVEDIDLRIEGGTVRRVPRTQTSADLEGWMLPGLVDAHCHIGIDKSGPRQDADLLAQQARVAHNSGVLLVRDCGLPFDNRAVNEQPDGVRLLHCGQHIAKYKRYIRGLAVEVERDADLPQQMAYQARRSDGWIKLVGDWIDRADGADSTLQPLFSTEALKDGVQAAHEAGARVTVHTFARATIESLLEARVDCIEHGTGMTLSQMREAAQLGIAVTPTIIQVDLFPSFASSAGTKYPVYRDDMLGLYSDYSQTLRDFAESGLTLLPGTDSGSFQPHGSIAKEIMAFTRMGLTNAQILDRVTWQARDFLGFPSLSDGEAAHAVVYDRDPREDLSVLASPHRVVYEG